MIILAIFGLLFLLALSVAIWVMVWDAPPESKRDLLDPEVKLYRKDEDE